LTQLLIDHVNLTSLSLEIDLLVYFIHNFKIAILFFSVSVSR
jgi:hypothetical protein